MSIMSINKKNIPYNEEVEQALLFCLLNDNDIVNDIIEDISLEDFFVERHKLIFKVMYEIYRDREVIEIIGVVARLEKSGVLDKCGGKEYLTLLNEKLPMKSNYKKYFDILKRDSINRKLIEKSNEIIDKCLISIDEKQSLAFAEKSIYDISQKRNKSSPISIGEITDEVLNKFDLIANNKDAFKGLQTGFLELDKITNGLQKGDLIIVAGRPAMGKTSFAMNIVEYAGIHNDKVCAVFSLEMPRDQIIQRLVCSYCNVDMSKALSGKLTQNDWLRLQKNKEKIINSTIFIDDTSRLTVSEILSKCRRLKARQGRLDLIMIDYIQLMSGNVFNIENRQQEIANITRDLKAIAKELDVPVLALSQLRRLLYRTEPELSDLRESGAIEQDADIVMFISRADFLTDEELAKKKLEKGDAEIKIAKHRNGALGSIKLHFKGELTKFVNIAQDEEKQKT